MKGRARSLDLAQDKARIMDRCLGDEARDSGRSANQSVIVLDWLVVRDRCNRAEGLPQEV